MVIGSVLAGLAVNGPVTTRQRAPSYTVVTTKLNPYRLYPGESQTLHLMRTADEWVAGAKLTLCGRGVARRPGVFAPSEATCGECKKRAGLG